MDEDGCSESMSGLDKDGDSLRSVLPSSEPRKPYESSDLPLDAAAGPPGDRVDALVAATVPAAVVKVSGVAPAAGN